MSFESMLIAFTDGTAIVIEAEQTCDEMLTLSVSDAEIDQVISDFADHEIVRLGLATQDEIDEHRKQIATRYEAHQNAILEAEYERLKKELGK